MRARLITVERVADTAAGFWFELGAPFEFQPGQTCAVTLPTSKYHDDRGNSRTFSIASSPADMPRLLVATRLTGSAFKRSLEEAASGTEVEIDGPYGSLTLHRNAAKPAVLMAGGIGITPFRSIVKDATERKLPHALTLFYSNRTAASTAFLPDLELWQSENPNFPACGRRSRGLRPTRTTSGPKSLRATDRGGLAGGGIAVELRHE